MRRIVLALAMTTGLAIGTVVPASALDTSVTLNCSDGTSVKLLVDADTLTSLTQAVQAMIDYPAGLSCTLIQNPLGVTFGSVALAGAGNNGFIVGGGRWQIPCDSIFFQTGIDGGLVARVPGAWYSLSASTPDFVWVNIAVNVHRTDIGAFYGSLNETIPANQSCPGHPQVGESHFGSSPVCFSPAGTGQPKQGFPVFVTAKVTETSGQIPFPTGPNGSDVTAGPPDFYVHFGFQDTGNPAPADDTLNGPPADPTGSTNSTDSTCTKNPSPAFNLGTNDGTGPKQYGNITVHQAG